MKVLVTGSKGMLGQDLCPILKNANYTVIETDIDTLDITKLDEVERIISTENPDIVIHCAAYTAVDAAEENVELCRKVKAFTRVSA